MKFYLALTKKGLAAVICVLLTCLLLIGWYCSLEKDYPDGSTNTLRVYYIKSLGLDADDSTATQKEIVIPESFSDVYKNYNGIQKKAGFDLTLFKGDTATVYTYPLKESDRLVHLIVTDGKIIGGDIADVSFKGNMQPLLRAE